MIKKSAIAAALCFVLTAIVFVVLISVGGVPFKYMDLNDSGLVSLREAIRTMDMSVREVNIDGKKCVEIYELKDGLPIKQICPAI